MINTSPMVIICIVSTHSRLKAADWDRLSLLYYQNVSTHSRPKATESLPKPPVAKHYLFQHTAARRRPKSHLPCHVARVGSFNTQPPEGDRQTNNQRKEVVSCFNTQPPEGDRALSCLPRPYRYFCFNTQPPEGDRPKYILY